MTTDLFNLEHEEPEKAKRSGRDATEVELDESSTGPAAADGTWESYLPRLRERFPGTKDGTLFCVQKLEENPDLTLKDFKAEAQLRGVPLSGRSLHSAKVLLGMEAPPKRRRTATEDEPEPPTPRAGTRRSRTARSPVALDDALGDLGADLENALRRAVDEAAHARTEQLRDAIRRAVEVLQDALDD